jgi:hypothetical protein
MKEYIKQNYPAFAMGVAVTLSVILIVSAIGDLIIKIVMILNP